MPRQLLVGENLVLPPLHRHWIVLVRGLWAPLLGTVIVLALVNVTAHDILPGELRLVVSLLALAVLGVWLILAWLRWTEDALTVTDQRVILEEGVFQRSSRVIPLDRIQDVSTSQTLLGRLLDYGSVAIDAAGTGASERFDHVRSPEAVRDRVFVLVGNVRRR